MAKHSEFKSRDGCGKTIDGFVVCLFLAQVVLLVSRVLDHGDHMPWWLVFVPLYIICVPLLLIAFGVSQASKK